MVLDLPRILQRKTYEQICKRKFSRAFMSGVEPKILKPSETSVKINKGFMMIFNATTNIQEPVKLDFWHGKKTRFGRFIWCAFLKRDTLYAQSKGVHPIIVNSKWGSYLKNLLLISHSYDHAKLSQIVPTVH